MHSFTNNTDKSHVVVPAPTISAKHPFMRLKRKRLGPIIDLKEVRRERAMAGAMEVEGKEEEDTPCPLAREEGKKDSYSQKMKHAASGSSSVLKRVRYTLYKISSKFLFLFSLVLLNMWAKRLLCYLCTWGKDWSSLSRRQSRLFNPLSSGKRIKMKRKLLLS